MEKINISILLILCFTFISRAYSTDSLLRNQIKATNNDSTQIEIPSKGISNLKENKINSSNIVIAVRDFEKITTQLDSISKKNSKAIEGLNDTMKAKELSWLEKSIPHIFGGLIGAGGAILVFFCTRRKENKQRKKEMKQNIKEKNDRLSSLIESSIRIAKSISSHLMVFQFKINFNPSEFPALGFTSYQDIIRLSKLFDDDKYYHAFLKKYKSDSEAESLKNFNNISGSVDYLITQIPHFYDWHKNNKIADIERKNRYVDAYKKIENDIDLIVKKIDNKLSHFLLNFMRSYYSLNSNGEKIKFLDLDFTQKKIIEPLVAELNNNFSEISEAKDLLNNLDKAGKVYDEIQKLNLGIVEDFKNELIVFRETIVTLESIYKTLNNKTQQL